jgi:3-hydroxyisobutyrate dehydrogenase-like beta-hydroxyacid dehydrogenase
MTETNPAVLGFVGLGVMGGAMCRNMALKHAGEVLAFDTQDAAFEAVAETKARRVASLAELAAQADVVFLSLPAGPAVVAVCLGAQGLSSGAR